MVKQKHNKNLSANVLNILWKWTIQKPFVKIHDSFTSQRLAASFPIAASSPAPH